MGVTLLLMPKTETMLHCQLILISKTFSAYLLKAITMSCTLKKVRSNTRLLWSVSHADLYCGFLQDQKKLTQLKFKLLSNLLNHKVMTHQVQSTEIQIALKKK